MRLLCNLPLECFDERSAMHGVELVTFGPPQRMWIDGQHFPFDVAFDPSREHWDTLLARLPAGFRPDAVLLYWPDQEPLPAGLEHCAVPVIGVISDYNVSLPYLVGLWPFFDLLLCDRGGVDLFQKLSFAEVHYWNQYAHKRPFHRQFRPFAARELDVGFAGNLNPAVQRERAPWLERLRRLGERGIRAEVRTGIFGHDYADFLNHCRVGWNRSVRGELNLRAFEVAACGAVLLMEQSNREVADFFAPGEECVLYGDDLEDVLAELLADPARMARIAAAGHRRVQQHRLGKRLSQLVASLAQFGCRRPRSTPFERSLGRATAMLATWADGAAVAAAALQAQRLSPDDPRALNLLGLAAIRQQGAAGAPSAARLWQAAIAAAPDYLPAAVNLRALAVAGGDLSAERQIAPEVSSRQQVTSWLAVDGPVCPLNYGQLSLARAQALQDAVRGGDPQPFAQALASC